MIYKGQIIAWNDSSYKSKKGEHVAQHSCTCLDAEAVKMMDTVDVTFPPEVLPDAKSMIGKVVSFDIVQVRFQTGQRIRFVAKSVAKAA